MGFSLGKEGSKMEQRLCLRRAQALKSSTAGCFWLRVSHEGAVKTLAGAEVISGFF